MCCGLPCLRLVQVAGDDAHGAGGAAAHAAGPGQQQALLLRLMQHVPGARAPVPLAWVLSEFSFLYYFFTNQCYPRRPLTNQGRYHKGSVVIADHQSSFNMAGIQKAALPVAVTELTDPQGRQPPGPGPPQGSGCGRCAAPPCPPRCPPRTRSRPAAPCACPGRPSNRRLTCKGTMMVTTLILGILVAQPRSGCSSAERKHVQRLLRVQHPSGKYPPRCEHFRDRLSKCAGE